jgi:uncharacterized phage protein (TIGR01671 family)
MREIKFRGKRKDDGELVVGYYGYKDLTDEHFIIVPTFDAHSDNRPQYFTDYLVLPETVSEFTGLTDINGKEIFEGDIVLMDILDTQNNKTLNITDEQRKELFKRDLEIITFQKGSFGFYPAFPDLNHPEDREWKPIFHQSEDDFWSVYMLIVGNVYETPELLK